MYGAVRVEGGRNVVPELCTFECNSCKIKNKKNQSFPDIGTDFSIGLHKCINIGIAVEIDPYYSRIMFHHLWGNQW